MPSERLAHPSIIPGLRRVARLATESVLHGELLQLSGRHLQGFCLDDLVRLLSTLDGGLRVDAEGLEIRFGKHVAQDLVRLLVFRWVYRPGAEIEWPSTKHAVVDIGTEFEESALLVQVGHGFAAEPHERGTGWIHAGLIDVWMVVVSAKAPWGKILVGGFRNNVDFAWVDAFHPQDFFGDDADHGVKHGGLDNIFSMGKHTATVDNSPVPEP